MRKRRMGINTAECVLPKDIDKLHPVIGERALVGFYGDGVSRLMPLKSITPRYIGFLAADKTGWVEVKVKRVWNNEGANFLCWRDRTGRLHCQLQEAERKED